MDNPYLVGGLEHFGNVIIPTDELIFFRGVRIPPTNYGQTPTKSPWFLVTPPLNHHEPPPCHTRAVTKKSAGPSELEEEGVIFDQVEMEKRFHQQEYGFKWD